MAERTPVLPPMVQNQVARILSLAAADLAAPFLATAEMLR